MKVQAVSFDDVFAKFEGNEEFEKAERRLKPYYDLVTEIIRRRNELGITQKELADKAGTHQSRISKIESAELDVRLSTLIQIAEALETEISVKLVPIDGPIPVASDDKASAFFKSVMEVSATGMQNFSKSKTGILPVKPVYA